MGLHVKKAVVIDEEAETESGVPTGPIGAVSTEEAYQVSVWSNSKGEFGAGCKVFVRPVTGETLEQAARRANAFATGKLREAEQGIAESRG